jgi:hypothetical protein
LVPLPLGLVILVVVGQLQDIERVAGRRLTRGLLEFLGDNPQFVARLLEDRGQPWAAL